MLVFNTSDSGTVHAIIQATMHTETQQLMSKVQIDPGTITEISIEPNSCFTIRGNTPDGEPYLYKGSKGIVNCYLGQDAIDACLWRISQAKQSRNH